MNVNGIKICQFEANDSELKPYSFCLVNISKDFAVDKTKKTGLNGYVYNFYVDYNINDVRDIVDIHKYLMEYII